MQLLQKSLKSKASDIFSGSLPIVAAAFGRNMGVRIELGGMPFTDGKTIHLPNIDSASEQKEREILGLLCHECGHVRYTDLTVCKGARTEFEKALDNALEDVRIESQMTREYSGAEALLRAAHETVVKGLEDSVPTAAATLVPLHVLCTTECELLRREWLQRLSERTRAQMVQTLGEELTDRITALAMDVGHASSTQDVQLIRSKIVEAMQMAVDKDAQKLEKTSGKRGPEQPPDHTEQRSASGSAANQEEVSLSEAPSLNAKQAKAVQTALATSKGIDNPMDLSQTFEELGKANPRSIRNSHDPVLDLSGSIRPRDGKPQLGAERLASAKADSVALRHSLLGLVEAKARTGRYLSVIGRRISCTHLARLSVGNCRVFEKRVEKPSPNTAVHVLLDLSGSMGTDGGDLAVRTSLGLILGLQGIRGTNPALTVFPGVACGQRPYAVCPILRHGERLDRVPAAELGAMHSYGSTPLALALTHARIELMRCREDARAVILITDGPYLTEAARTAIDRLKANGIRIFAILVSPDDNNPLAEKIPHSERISSIDELKGVLYRFAKELLL